MLRRLLLAFGALLVGSFAQAEPVVYDWFEYTGRDAVFEQPLPPGHYRNPILSGFHPDPSITRAGDRFYLVHSTFAYFPGIPVFESRDLVHWRQIGNVIDRPSQLDFSKLGVSRGVFAPSIEYRDGLFYVFNTLVDGGGNYVVTAKNPAGPWSDPTWLPELEGGIDPSMFVDDDGRAYVLNNGPPEGAPRYDGHRAIWIQEFDRAALQLQGPRKVLVDGGVDPSKNPIWIEGPHIYKRAGWYYLSCAEGGTGPQHSQVVLRARSPWGPFEAYAGNPILTQRDLPADRQNPVTNAGHADLVQAPDGTWWATFLATRTYEGVHYNTGRETFLLPVKWRDGWPIILEHGRAIPQVVRGPNFMEAGDQKPLSGNFTWRDEFDEEALDKAWLQLRAREWFDLRRTWVHSASIRKSRGSMMSRLRRFSHAGSSTWCSTRRRSCACQRSGHRSGARGISERDPLVLPRHASRRQVGRDLCGEEERRAPGDSRRSDATGGDSARTQDQRQRPCIFVLVSSAAWQLAGARRER